MSHEQLHVTRSLKNYSQGLVKNGALHDLIDVMLERLFTKTSTEPTTLDCNFDQKKASMAAQFVAEATLRMLLKRMMKCHQLKPFLHHWRQSSSLLGRRLQNCRMTIKH